MPRRHHFHVDHAGHSVTATVQTGRQLVVEVLVDGKETGHARADRDRPTVLPIELPTDPPTPAEVRATPGPGVPRCVLELADGERHVMSPRPCFPASNCAQVGAVVSKVALPSSIPAW